MKTDTLIHGLAFGEGPRWRDGTLWLSDMHDHRVLSIGLDGTVRTVLEMPDDEPSGLGWLPDGRLLVVAMESGQLRVLGADGSLLVHADLSGLATGSINDMIVRSDGTAYVGHMGYRIHEGGERRSAETILVTPDGSVSVAADGLEAPNGHVLTADETTLIVAESAAFRLTAFDVAADGTLSGRRTFAELTPGEGARVAPPDGICGDVEGAIWVADPVGARVFRVLEGGEVTDSISFEDVIPVACVLGGDDRRELLICVAADWKREVVTARRTGRVEGVRVAVPGAGKP